ncbi:hypothetical protein SRRS_53960 [Sporomusa rhizae]|uniref:AsmA family protein n=1 Tax=Sporomusa rhizae TaxID=357999 RepID=UPI00352AE6C2
MADNQQIITINPQKKWSKKKIGLLIFAVVFLAGTILFQLAAGKVRQAAEQALLVQVNEAVNGQIIVGDIDLSILGYVQAKEVQVISAAGKPLAKINRVQIRYNWSDLIKGQLGPQLIQRVTLEKPEFWIICHQDSLNWDGFLKTTKKEQSGFAGIVKIQDGKLHLETDFFEKTADQLTGELAFRQEDEVGLSATGKVDQAALRLDGQWIPKGISEITLSAKGMEVAKLGLTTADAPLQLADGSLDELTVKIGKDNSSGAILVKTLAGRFSNVTTTGALVLTECSAEFEKQGDAFQFSNGQALYQGQTITASGQVLTAPSGEKTLDFAIQLPAGDPAVMLPDLQAGGVLTAQGKVSGSAFSPVLSGNFTLGSLQFGDMLISDINGTFSYTQQTLQLLTAKGATIGGSVAASGTIYPATQQYSLSISGSGLDTSQLSKKDVSGPLSLTGSASGSTSTATVKGSFAIHNGKAYGISFRTLTGNFIKKGSAEVEVSNLVIKTDFGVFYPEQLSQSVIERLHDRNLPATSTELKEKVKEKVTEKVTEKLLEKLFDKG